MRHKASRDNLPEHACRGLATGETPERWRCRGCIGGRNEGSDLRGIAGRVCTIMRIYERGQNYERERCVYLAWPML